MRGQAVLAAMLIIVPAPLLAQARKPAKPATPIQQVVPPKTVYWLTASTTSGFGLGGKAPSAGDMMKLAMGGSSAPAKGLELDLGSKLPPSGPPEASHAIPPGMNMGAVLPLKTPKRDKPVATKDEPEREEKPDYERPKGKLMLFWGCGETARQGQPIVIDFAKLAAGQVPPNLFAGERVRIARGPTETSWPSYGHWPNDDRKARQSVPADASLLGAHKITGNYTPAIDFTLAQDWLAGLDLKQTTVASGALGLGWNSVPAATAYFAQMFGGAQASEGEGGTIVFWSSSELQTFISGLSDYIAPSEVARLVGKKQLLPPTQTSCTIPKEAMAATQGGLISLVAHGPEANFVYPPRPSDPRTPWVQEWAVKARFVSRTGAVAGMDMPAGRGSAAAGKTGKPKCQPSAGSSVGEALAGSVGGAIGGLFGKKKKSVDCE